MSYCCRKALGPTTVAVLLSTILGSASAAPPPGTATSQFVPVPAASSPQFSPPLVPTPPIVPAPSIDPMPLQVAAPPSVAAKAPVTPEPSLLTQVQSWWRTLLNFVGIDDSTPSAAETRALAATARDPNTGFLRLESAAMQCAVSCERNVNDELNICQGFVTPEELARRGIAPPTANCAAELHDQYSACLVACGLPAPPALLPSAPAGSRRVLPPIGTPAALSARPL